MGLIEQIEAENMKESVPQFNVGDTVKVGYRIIEGGKERIQNFEGVVIAKKNGGIRLYRAPSVLRRGRGALLPPSFAEGRVRHRRARRQGAPRKALLSARAHGQGCQDQGKEVISAIKKTDPLKVRGGSVFL